MQTLVKKRILFVDDEANILSGLRRMLYPMRGQWAMEFAESATTALGLMAESPFDLVATDMRMPDMDGEQLLIHVRERYPSTVRVVLSGYSDKAISLLTSGVAHQLLGKPCNADTLKEIIERTTTFQTLIPNPAIQQLLGSIETLPTLPTVYAELKRLLDTPGASPAHIGAILSHDIGLTTKVLQLVNSAFFSLRTARIRSGKGGSPPWLGYHAVACGCGQCV